MDNLDELERQRAENRERQRRTIGDKLLWSSKSVD
jgi:hypothetical protein